jgi:hypothetical protein
MTTKTFRQSFETKLRLTKINEYKLKISQINKMKKLKNQPGLLFHYNQKIDRIRKLI